MRIKDIMIWKSLIRPWALGNLHRASYIAHHTLYFVQFGIFFLVSPSFGQSFESRINDIASAHNMAGGAVVVFCENGIIKSQHFGKADMARNIEVTEDTKFRIASISKTITAIAAMQLVENNLLNIDDNISSILGYTVVNPNQPNASITPRMLLSHTSTIIDGSTYSSFLSATTNNNPIPNLSEILTQGGAYYSTNLFNNAGPGSYFNYSNLNYVILGTIVEKASGLRFDEYCKQNIFQPLGMDASFNLNDLQDINQVAVLYRLTNNTWTPQADNYQGVQPVFTNLSGYVPGTNGGRFGPQGGLRISAKDLATLFMCLSNPGGCPSTLLSEGTINQMISNQWTHNGSNGNNYGGLFLSWGLGLQRITSTPAKDIALSGSSLMFGHTGEAYGLVSDAFYDTTRKAGFVFITNGVGAGYNTNNQSAFYTVEQEIFDAIEKYGEIQSCTALNIQKEKTGTGYFTISPNPGSTVVQVNTEHYKHRPLLTVNSSDGRQVLTSQITSPQNFIDVSSLSKGVYVFNLEKQSLKFVKD
jgi:CubicO group peptidase (beta-lactamase class C family)